MRIAKDPALGMILIPLAGERIGCEMGGSGESELLAASCSNRKYSENAEKIERTHFFENGRDCFVVVAGIVFA